jgi:hypothetical protein
LSLRLSFADINLWCTLSGDFYPDTLNKHLLCEKVLVGMKDDRSGRGNLLLVSSAGPIQQNTVCRQVNLFNMLRRQSELGWYFVTRQETRKSVRLCDMPRDFSR